MPPSSEKLQASRRARSSGSGVRSAGIHSMKSLQQLETQSKGTLCRNCLWSNVLTNLSGKKPCSGCEGKPVLKCRRCKNVYSINHFPEEKSLCEYCITKEDEIKEARKKARTPPKLYLPKPKEIKLSALKYAYRGIGYSIKRGNRRRKNIDPAMTLEYVINLAEKQNYKCALTGIPLQVAEHKGWAIDAPSLDRIDSSKGYEVGNVRWVCLWANLARSQYPDEDFYRMCKTAAEYRGDLITRGLEDLFGGV